MTSSARLRLLAVLFLALVAPLSGGGCAYMSARGKDFSQVFRVEIGPALAFGFDTRLFGLMDLGLGGGFHWDAGWEYGEGYLGKQETIVAPGVCLRGMGPTAVWSHECPSVLPPLLAQEQYTLAEFTHLGTFRHEFDFEVGIMAVLLHFRFGLSPAEFGDAFAGIFGFDPSGDDGGGGKPAPAPDIPVRPERFDPPPEGRARPVGETPPPGTEYRKIPADTTQPAPRPAPPPETRSEPAPKPAPRPAPPRTAPKPAPPPPQPADDDEGEIIEPKAPPRRS